MLVSLVEVGEVADDAEAAVDSVLVLQLLADDAHEAEEGALVEEAGQVFGVDVEDLDVGVFDVV